VVIGQALVQGGGARRARGRNNRTLIIREFPVETSQVSQHQIVRITFMVEKRRQEKTRTDERSQRIASVRPSRPTWVPRESPTHAEETARRLKLVEPLQSYRFVHNIP